MQWIKKKDFNNCTEKISIKITNWYVSVLMFSINENLISQLNIYWYIEY